MKGIKFDGGEDGSWQKGQLQGGEREEEEKKKKGKDKKKDAHRGARTLDHNVKSVALYRLS